MRLHDKCGRRTRHAPSALPRRAESRRSAVDPRIEIADTDSKLLDRRNSLLLDGHEAHSMHTRLGLSPVSGALNDLGDTAHRYVGLYHHARETPSPNRGSERAIVSQLLRLESTAARGLLLSPPVTAGRTPPASRRSGAKAGIASAAGRPGSSSPGASPTPAALGLTTKPAGTRSGSS